MRPAAIAVSTALIGASVLLAPSARAAQDRYGPQGAASPSTAAFDGPMLNWPGKTAPVAQPAPTPPPAPLTLEPPPPPPAPPPAAVSAMPAPVVAAPTAQPAPPVAPRPRMASADAHIDWVKATPIETQVQLAKATPPPAAVVVVKAAPVVPLAHGHLAKVAPAGRPVRTAKVAPPLAAPTVQAAATPAPDSPAALPPRRYSVARQFGLTPDPIPLPQQFFADSAAADLAAPPPALPPHPVPGSQAVDSTASANTPANRARAIALDTPSPDGSD